MEFLLVWKLLSAEYTNIMTIKWFQIKYTYNCVILWCFSEDDGKVNIGKCKIDILIHRSSHYAFVSSLVRLPKTLWFSKGPSDVNEDIARSHSKAQSTTRKTKTSSRQTSYHELKYRSCLLHLASNSPRHERKNSRNVEDFYVRLSWTRGNHKRQANRQILFRWYGIR